jgi:single-strand selective monofunctional uracil DNA glycosylase
MLREITDDLVADLAGLTFGLPTAFVYNPLVYARAPWDLYCERYGQGRREALLWGMNPGPFGMSQSGVPFGEVSYARDWLGLEAPVGKPPREHPKRPVEGFSCRRSEVSGARLWGWARDSFGTPEAFFSRFFIANYCPLVFMEESGRNRTPDKLPASEREPLFGACDRAMLRTIEHFQPRFVIGVGMFAEDRLRAVLAGTRRDVVIGRVPHPSPASPLANGGWSGLMTKALGDLGLSG